MGCAHTEIIIVILVVALVMGVNRLPQIGDALGRAIRNFKSSFRGENEIDVTPRKNELPQEAQKPTRDKDEEA